ncbi:MAG: glutaredoxin family protein [Thermonemataceae bacterium]
MEENQNHLTLFGTDWCPKSAALRNALQTAWVDFAYHNVETDETAAAEIKAQYDGELKFPVVKLEDEYLKNPSWQVLRERLKEKGLL